MRTFLFACSLALLSAACGPPSAGASSSLVGAACASDQQCQSICVMGGQFPGGMCSVRCNTDNDCPQNAACINAEKTGVCAVVCLNPNDCAAFGRGYTCSATDRFATDGKINICRVP